MMSKKLIVILGPTASGKSALAVAIAKKYNGEIVSADSRQVYKGLDIGSGKIAKKEMRGIPHHLLDVASPKKTFTVAHYQKLGAEAIEKILAKKKVPVIAGGTGLYIDALLYGYSFPPVTPDPKLRRALEKKSAEELFLTLKKLDPRRAATIDRHNKRRLIRALEIALRTGEPIPELKRESAYRVLKIGIAIPAERLKKQIRKRLLSRLAQGMIAEVKKLHDSGIRWGRLDELGLEYRYVSRYLRGLITKDGMVEILEKEIWHYAKRQMTWFKRDKEIIWVKGEKEAFAAAKKFLK